MNEEKDAYEAEIEGIKLEIRKKFRVEPMT